MAKPNSVTTKIRQLLVTAITPYPKPGLAWCIDCKYNDGLTWEMLESVIRTHVEGHNKADHVSVVLTQPDKNQIRHSGTRD